MARKPLGATPRDRFLRIRLTEGGMKAVERLAKKAGESKSDYVRRLIKEDATRQGDRG